jgi:hypothetical protein
MCSREGRFETEAIANKKTEVRIAAAMVNLIISHKPPLGLTERIDASVEWQRLPTASRHVSARSS